MRLDFFVSHLELLTVEASGLVYIADDEGSSAAGDGDGEVLRGGLDVALRVVGGGR